MSAGNNEESKNAIRTEIASLIANHRQAPRLIKRQSTALQPLQMNKSIIILSADNGRVTVVMDREDYVSRFNTLLDGKE